MTPINAPRITVFPTPIGWTGIVRMGKTIVRTATGYPDRASLFRSLGVTKADATAPSDPASSQLQRFASGKETSLASLLIDESWMSPFQRRVVRACRAIPWGETLTYGQLATLAGSPGASRAVGSVMAKNRFPLIVPCHRVVAAEGTGGFSAPGGIGLKEVLLENERGADARRVRRGFRGSPVHARP